jgi:hypothetical protein
MKLFCCHTPNHDVLFREHFLPSVPDGFTVVPHLLEIEGNGDFMSAGFLRCVQYKVQLVLESIRRNPGETLVWSDVDIRLLRVTPRDLEFHLGEHDFACQREWKKGDEVNVGFFVCRASERTERFFSRVIEGLELEPEKHEQYMINRLLREPDSGISATQLPLSYYARSHGFPPPPGLAIYHANCTEGPDGIARKIAQFRELETFLRYETPIRLGRYLRRRAVRFGRSLKKRLGAE